MLQFKWVIFVYAWLLPFTAAVRPSLEILDGQATRSRLLLDEQRQTGERVATPTAPTPCSDEEDVKQQLQGLGLRGEGHPCNWTGVTCNGCAVVEISSSDAKGNLEFLQNMSDLTQIDLDNSQASGDIGALQNLINLRQLWLSNTKVSGDVAALTHLVNLESIDLAETMVFGDLATVQNLTELQFLNLGGTAVSGDVAGLQNLATLQVMSLSKTKVSGGVAALTHLVNLKSIDLAETMVFGDLATVQNLTELQDLNLDGTAVSGDVAGLQNLANLQQLLLCRTNVSGDLAALTHEMNLKSMYLAETMVFGDLATVQNLTELQDLILDGTAVSGDVAGLKNLANLQQVSLSKTKVSGDVAALMQLVNLEGMYFHETMVFGDLATLQKLTELEDLILDGTAVSGDVAGLQNLANLREVGLSKTKVWGDVATLQQLASLWKLRLGHTKVSGDVAALNQLTNLQQLLLGQTDVGGDVASLQHCTKLQELSLAHTQAFGDIVSVIGQLKDFAEADLSGSQVMGSLVNLNSSSLRKLSLADTKIKLGEAYGDKLAFSSNAARNWLPALQSLNVSGCWFNVTIEQFLLPLAGTPASIIGAARCGLTGRMIDLAALTAHVDGLGHGAEWYSILGKSLQVLDVSGNKLYELGKLPAKLRVEVQQNQRPLVVSPEVIIESVLKRIDVWLSNTELSNRQEVEKLLRGHLSLTGVWVDSQQAYACQDFGVANLRVTPHLFLPNSMCGCRPGYNGTGVQCSACQANSFSSQMNQTVCKKCPPNSTASAAAISQTDCKCIFGSIESVSNGRLACHCPKDEALSTADGICVACNKLHLQCPNHGTIAAEADVKFGFARLQNGSEKVYRCLHAEHCVSSGCGTGYTGPLCSDCKAKYRSSGKDCIKCNDATLKEQIHLLALSVAGVIVVIGVLAILRRYIQLSSLRLGLVMQLLVLQLPMLLQLVQLWAVLGRLAKPMEITLDDDGLNDTDAINEGREENQSDVMLSYLELLLLTGAEVQFFFAFQCIFDGLTVRSLFAVATPVFPLVLLVCCGFWEFFGPAGMGIRTGLKILTLFYIGGASGCVQLLGCQHVDGTGRVLLDVPFRQLFPQWQCKEAKWVDWVGRTCATCYGIVIPCFLAFLFVKQHVIMRKADAFMTPVTKQNGKASVHFEEIVNEQGVHQSKDQGKYLLAAAAAYVAARTKGRAFVELQDDAAMVTFGHYTETDEFSVESLISQDAKEVELIRYNLIRRMLTERTVMEESQADRVMLGAKDLFYKYAKCQNVWLEICSKVAAAALVSVVSSRDGLWLSVAITLGMALTIGFVQPFAYRQANSLQISCFACLALAAVGFHHHSRLSHVSLALPFLLAAAQVLRPDSREAVALRLQKELAEKIPAGGVELCANEVRLM